MKIYLDTSAYIASFFDDKQGREINLLINQSEIFTSSLLLIESERTFYKLYKEKTITDAFYISAINKIKEDTKNIQVIDIADEIFLNGIFPPVSIPRTLDLIHLRTALSLNKDQQLDLFLSLDNKLNTSAESLGFKIYS